MTSEDKKEFKHILPLRAIIENKEEENEEYLPQEMYLDELQIKKLNINKIVSEFVPVNIDN